MDVVVVGAVIDVVDVLDVVVVVVAGVRIGVNVAVRSARDTPPASGSPPRLSIVPASGQLAGGGASGMARIAKVPSTISAMPVEVL
jgi:hypothetical protein